MKKILLKILIFQALINVSKAQIVAPTTSTSGWSGMVSQLVGKSSDMKYLVNGYAWLAAPITPPSGHSTFLSLASKDDVPQTIETTISGLTQGKYYKLKYSIMTSEVELEGGPQYAEWADFVYMQITGAGTDNLASEKLVFTPGVDTQKWLQRSLTFKAPGSTVKFSMGTKKAGIKRAIVNLDFKDEPIELSCEYLEAFSITYTKVIFKNCPQASVNLNAAYDGGIPNGAKLVWFKDEYRLGSPIAEPTMVSQPGQYYLFFYDEFTNCYNGSVSKATVTVKDPEIQLSKDTLKLTCYGQGGNLSQLFVNSFASIPDGASLVWYKNPTHSDGGINGGKIVNPTNVPAGTYYPFFYTAGHLDCFSTDNATQKVVVKNPTPISLGYDHTVVVCPDGVAKLPDAAIGVPFTSQLKYFKDNAAQGPEFTDWEHAPIGDYYAFSYDPTKQCMSENVSKAKFTVKQVPEVYLLQDTVTIDCPDKFVDITNLTLSAGSGVVRWFLTANRVGKPVISTHALEGTYYGFYFDEVNNCYNTNLSNTKLTVLGKRCDVVLQLKVKLQGSMAASGTVMRNDLQKYDAGKGLIPIIDPYGSKASYPEISNPAGVAGSISDWVRVEIRSSSNPSTVLEAKSLLLRVDGSVLDMDGQSPKFLPQAENVHIIVKHRNHIPIMSRPVSFNVDVASYDFTDAIAKAFNDGSVPDQMKLVNGVWCMINGDVNQDKFVQNTDMSQTRNAFNQGIFGTYSSRDLNMDGFVQNNDVAIQRNRFNASYFSILSKY